jgi:type I site-specific restriction-modification system R (restriction) subunit
MTVITEDSVEYAAVEWFESLGYEYLDARTIAPSEPNSERDSFGDVALERRLHEAIARLNPEAPTEAREDALRKVLRVEGPSLIAANQIFHRMFQDLGMSGAEDQTRNLQSSITPVGYVQVQQFSDSSCSNIISHTANGYGMCVPTVSGTPGNSRIS